MTVRPDAQQLHIDPAELGEQLLVPRARAGDVIGPHFGPEQAIRREVDLVGQLATDERAIGVWVVGREPDVLVEQHGAGPGEAHATLPVFLDEQGVGTER